MATVRLEAIRFYIKVHLTIILSMFVTQTKRIVYD